jgi:hypothetical protein
MFRIRKYTTISGHAKHVQQNLPGKYYCLQSVETNLQLLAQIPTGTFSHQVNGTKQS